MIFDCFTFFDELDVLELRLRALSDVVDRFVLVEGTETHQGDRKPLHFRENAERFSDFADRIEHVVVDDPPSLPSHGPWARERHQRSAIVRGLRDSRPGDGILISDVDELPAPANVRACSAHPGIHIFNVSLHYYFLNSRLKGDPYQWGGARPAMVRRGSKLPSPQEVRDFTITLFATDPGTGVRRSYVRLRHLLLRRMHRIKLVEQGGWHFSFLGSTEAIRRKIESYPHAELNRPEIKDPDRLGRLIERGADIFDRGLEFELVPLKDGLPTEVVENADLYRHLIAA